LNSGGATIESAPISRSTLSTFASGEFATTRRRIVSRFCHQPFGTDVVNILLEVIFWLCAACVLYTYVGYPLVLAVLARVCPRNSTAVGQPSDMPVSVVLAAHNEESRIGDRIRELVALVAARPVGGEVIAVSDGSTDSTVAAAWAAAREAEEAPDDKVSVIVLVQETNLGKSAALNRASNAARYPLLVFADTRQSWAGDAIDRLASGFADPAVGAVSGDLVLESAPGVMAGVGLYWRFEKWLRRTESRFDSMVSVTGCISAVRRDLFPTLPVGTILDDVYWPLAVAMGGHRVIHDEQASAFDRLPERARDEFYRKVRTLAGNFQLMASMPGALLPWRNRLWWQFISHRALRLAVPWALIFCLAANSVMTGPIYRWTFWGQVAFLAIGLAGSQQPIASRSRLASAIYSFLILNTAAWVAFWVWVTGRSLRSWRKISYAASELTATR
jgi:cellulose synthase/poly-beta-1,6-N-acetylglucosamine synthase-like glycosyltransferase